MTIDLITLIKVAPFTDEVRQKLFARLEKLTDQQKLELSATAWFAISQSYYAKLQYEKNKLLLEVQDGKRSFNKEDFISIEKKLLQETTQKLKTTVSAEALEEVRTQLQEQLQKKTPTA